MPARMRSVAPPYLLIVVCLLSAIPFRPATARPTIRLTYAELFKKSDVVVIASPISNELDGKREFEVELRSHEEFVEPVTTSFRIDAVLKGDIGTERLDLLHYRYKKLSQLRRGPSLVHFETQGPVVGKDLTGKELRADAPAYLLFLKSTPGKKYVVVSGQMDPDLAVKRLERAEDDLFRK